MFNKGDYVTTKLYLKDGIGYGGTVFYDGMRITKGHKILECLDSTTFMIKADNGNLSLYSSEMLNHADPDPDDSGENKEVSFKEAEFTLLCIDTLSEFIEEADMTEDVSAVSMMVIMLYNKKLFEKIFKEGE